MKVCLFVFVLGVMFLDFGWFGYFVIYGFGLILIVRLLFCCLDF